MSDSTSTPQPQRAALRLSSILASLDDAEPMPGEQPPGAAGAEPPDSPAASDSGNPLRRRLRRAPRPRSQMTIGEIIDRTSHAGFGFLLGFLALIAIPFFGLSTPFGLAIAFGATQMVLGFRKPWLPRTIRRRRVALSTLHWLSNRVSRWTSGMERLIRPRFTFLLQGPFWILCGLAIVLQGLGLALPLPIPGSNWVFIIPVIGYAIGLLEDDGLLIMLCHTVTAGQIVAAVWAWDVVWGGLMKGWAWLAPIFGGT